MPPGYTTVLFDLDGTLTDSKPGIVSSYRYALSSFGIEAGEAEISPWIGPPLRAGLAAFGIPDTDMATAIDRYRTHFGEVGMFDNCLYDGVTEALAELDEAGVTLGLATSKLTVFGERILAHFGIAEHFKVTVGSSQDGSRIEKTDIVSFALESLAWPDPAATALVGDRADDMRAAVHHGLFGVGAGWGYGSETELVSAGSRVIIDQPAGVTGLLLAQPGRKAT
jgi:phosphoglycolate phosphatase